LPIVHLEACEVTRDGRVFGGECFRHSNDAVVELACVVEMIDLDRNIGNADDLGSIGGMKCECRAGGEQVSLEHIVARANYIPASMD